ncbi:extracellular solute-binding protein [Microlunatus soli]|uniref:Putative aldouronate transport system substrate-binding protein n=1 Tax=Microlunatus soli TaxID=630515 RepID=A0A1H1W9G8_9ACTN|nr:extracellular solute-binding protein [Microlunatus soli]SDS93744.1 putative aldouronate transport system substrate-binding protein [Microlunatus soli]
MSSHVSRRGLLGGLIGVGAMAAVGSPLLSACSTGPKVANTRAAVNTVKLPTFVAFDGPTPQYPSSLPAAPSGFTKYPADTVRTVPKPPLTEPLSAMVGTFSPLPTGQAKNPAWKEVESRLGARLDLTIVPNSDYLTKFQTAIAGKKLPDVTLVSTIDHPAEFFNSVAVDLTAHLSGDAIKDYPNLAAIPTLAWKDCIVDNKIFKLPIPRGGSAGAGFYNKTLLDKAGITTMPTDTDDFLDALVELTRPQDGHWGFINTTGNTYFQVIAMMFGVPYGWRNDHGKLIADLETDEYAAAIEYMTTMVKKKLQVPGSDGIDGTARTNSFKAGKAAFVQDGLPGYLGYFSEMPEGEPLPYIPVGAPGQKGVTYFDNVTFGTTFINKKSEARIQQILGALNFFAAPFGSEEYTLLHYGIQGKDHTLDKSGSPVLTEQGSRDLTVPWGYLVGPGLTISNSDPDFVKQYIDANQAVDKMAVENPCKNLISPTSNEKGTKISTDLSDVRNDIIAGRKKMTDWKPAVEKWRKDGGDAMRQEYQSVL